MGDSKRRSPADERALLVALAVCCAGPMLLIVVLTSVVGLAIGPAVAAALGLVAAAVCVTVMIRHRRTPHRHNGDVSST